MLPPKAALRRWKYALNALASAAKASKAGATCVAAPVPEISVRRHETFSLIGTTKVSEDGPYMFVKYRPSVLENTGTINHVILRQRRPQVFCLDDFKVAQETKVDNTGNVCLWPAEEVLAYYCLKSANMFRAKRIVEIGSGLGLAGFLLAACTDASFVLITDGNPLVVENLLVNVDANRQAFPSAQVSCGLLMWHKPVPDELLHSFDFVLAADCCFFKEYHYDLLHTIHSLLRPNGTALVMAPRRGGTLDLFMSRAAAYPQGSPLTQGPLPSSTSGGLNPTASMHERRASDHCAHTTHGVGTPGTGSIRCASTYCTASVSELALPSVDAEAPNDSTRGTHGTHSGHSNDSTCVPASTDPGVPREAACPEELTRGKPPTEQAPSAEEPLRHGTCRMSDLDTPQSDGGLIPVSDGTPCGASWKAVCQREAALKVEQALGSTPSHLCATEHAPSCEVSVEGSDEASPTVLHKLAGLEPSPQCSYEAACEPSSRTMRGGHLPAPPTSQEHSAETPALVNAPPHVPVFHLQLEERYEEDTWAAHQRLVSAPSSNSESESESEASSSRYKADLHYPMLVRLTLDQSS